MLRFQNTRARAVTFAVLGGVLAAMLAASSAAADEATGSQMTVAWADGIIGADGNVVEERDPDHFMYEEFEDIEVTVSQTENLTSQAVEVTWTGAAPTSVDGSLLEKNFLQMMQCWGDEADGPSRDQCVYGGNVPTPFTHSVGIRNRRVAADPAETEYGDDYVPFVPANGAEPAPGNNVEIYFDRFRSNEKPALITTSDGTGETIFELQTAIEAPYLGCGAPQDGSGQETDGRDCWLVIVPRGETRIDGELVPENPRPLEAIVGSPLTATAWAQRIQIPLDFEPVANVCPLGNAERATVGTEMVAEAMTSWQPVLCQDGATYAYALTADAEARRQVVFDVDEAPGLAFTAAPVPSVDGQPEVLHAPVTVSGVSIAFNIEQDDGTIVKDLRLTPRLVAKALTQSYLTDVPGGDQYTRWEHPEEWADWMVDEDPNPLNMTVDPEFQELNPGLPVDRAASRNRLLVAIGNADAYREVWRWIAADDEAAEWLSGEPDEWGMQVNPVYEEMDLAAEPPQNFPREDPTCYPGRSDEIRPPGLCTLDKMPYLSDMNDAAVHARRALDGGRDWDEHIGAPDGQPGGWWEDNEPQLLGKRGMLAITDTASAANYGLPSARLQNAAGEFVAPTTESMVAGVEAMAPSEVNDSVLAIDPEAEAPAAYPLTMVSNAAVRTTQSEQALEEYAALLEYAVGPGQEPGERPGQLPPGFAPLPDGLRTQTLAVAEALVTGEEPEIPSLEELDPRTPGLNGPGGSAPPTGNEVEQVRQGGQGGPPPFSSPSASSGGGSGGDGVSGSGGSTTLDPPEGSDSPSQGQDPSGADDESPPPGDSQPVASATPANPVGAVRYILLGVLIAGIIAALAGPLLLRFGPRRFLPSSTS